MALWHMWMGLGFGLVAAIITVIANRPKPIKCHQDNYFSPPGAACPICLCEMQDRNMSYLPICHHALHTECLEQLRKRGDKKCPICRIVNY